MLASCAPLSSANSTSTPELTTPDSNPELVPPAPPTTDAPTENPTRSLREYNPVILGKDNWLFDGDPINKLIHSGGLDDTQIEQIAEELSYISASLEERGVHFLFLFVPDKYLVYPEFMPDRYKEGDVPSSYKSLSEALTKTDIDFIDCKPLLLDKKRETEYRLYYLRDRRWNQLGNFLIMQEVLAHLSKKYPVPKFEPLSIDTSETRICTTEIGNDLNNMIQSLSPWYEKGAPEPVYKTYSEPQAPSILWYGSCFSPPVVDMMQEGWPNQITYVSLWEQFGFPLSLREDLSRRLTEQKVVIFEVNEHYRQKLSQTLVPEPPKMDLSEFRARYNWQSYSLLQDWEPTNSYDIVVENEAVLVKVNDQNVPPTFQTKAPLSFNPAWQYYLIVKFVSPATTGILVDFSRTLGGMDLWGEVKGQHTYQGDNTVIFEVPARNNFGPVKNIRITFGDKAGIYSILQIAIYPKRK